MNEEAIDILKDKVSKLELANKRYQEHADGHQKHADEYNRLISDNSIRLQKLKESIDKLSN